MGKVSAMVQVHPHHRIPRVQHSELHGHICLGAGMWLHIGVFAAKKFFCAFSGKVFHHIHAFAPAIIPFSWIPFCIFISHRASHSCHNCLADPVFRSNQLDMAVLPLTSREGVLVKGGNHLETLAEAQIVAFDKTGTLTEGRFSVSGCLTAEGVSREELLELAAMAECRSNHPIAQSILAAYSGSVDEGGLEDFRERSGHGVSVLAGGRRILAGKRDFLTEAGVALPERPKTAATVVYVAADGVYRGAVLLRDAPKADAKAAISGLRALGVRETAMLSGDSAPVVAEIAGEIGLDRAVGELLPQDKLRELETLRSHLTGKGRLLYAGDGINDTPVLASADIGIAMGGLGADAAIETADVIIMGDEPSKIASGIRIARRTSRIATENIIFAIAVKVLVMLLSVMGYVELWAGVFADVGVCMLCVLNTLRINRK